MLKKFAIQVIFLLIVTFIALAAATGKIPNLPFIPQPTSFVDLMVGDDQLKVEIADTKEKRGKGLGGRDNLASDSGMLFIFDKEDKYAFWMKSVKFPLDMIWINDDRVVDFIKSAQPPVPGLKDEELSLYLPNQSINKVLEVNAGYIDAHDIKVGTEVKIIQ